MTTVLNITNTTGYNNWCPGHDHSVLNITKQQAMQIYVQAMTTIACCIGDIEYTVVMAWTPIFIACCIGDIEYTVLNITKQQAKKIGVQAMTTVLNITKQQAIQIGVHVTGSSVLYVCFADRCLSFCTFSFGRCVVCSSSIYGL
jgi:hypothetical protein